MSGEISLRFHWRKHELILSNRSTLTNATLVIHFSKNEFADVSLLKIKFKLSTTYHFQTNEQIEKTDQFLKQYLRHYVNNTQNNWITLLFITQLTLNVKVLNTIKESSFFANFEKDSNLFESFKIERTTQTVIEKIDILKKIHNSILQMQERSTTYQNKKRKTMSQFKKRNKIYFFTTNLKTTKLNKKLNHIKI